MCCRALVIACAASYLTVFSIAKGEYVCQYFL
nr:MAG TPA: hypothetical protein [Caudoviricetes sp.]